jgi:hypothetical protein
VKQSKFREAAVIAADRIRNNQAVELDEAIIEAHGDLVHYLVQAGLSAMAKDTAGFRRNWRDAQMTQSASQLSLPGMEHASLPAVVFDNDDNMMPVALATLAQIEREISRMERAVNTKVRVVGGYRATLNRLRELGVTDDQTGAEIAANFPNELER